MRELKASKTPWRDALKYGIRSKPRCYSDDNWSVCLKQSGGASIWKHYKTEDEAWEALYKSREDYLIDACAAYDLDPDDAKVFLDKYLIFDNGMIFNMHGNKLEGCPDQHGFLGGQFEGRGLQHHILIASMFVEKPQSYYRNVVHKDGNRQNNAASNLKWTTMAERWEEIKGNDPEKISKKNEVTTRLAKQLVDNDILRNKLPKVGMCLRKRSVTVPDDRRHDCVVTYVNPRGLWYEVQFCDSHGGGFKECFKLPEHTPNYS